MGGGLIMTTFEAGGWEFYNPVHLVAGSGVLKLLPHHLGEGRVLLVTTAGFTKRGLTAALTDLVAGRQLTVLDSVKPNPTIDTLESDARQLRGLGIKQVVALGGGSAVDSAKVLSFLLAPESRDFSLRDHFEKGSALPGARPLPLTAIPTTAGTGSEVTPFATVWDLPEEKKYSLSSPRLFARTALLDPELTLTLPRDLTVATGLDALSHALESIWNRNAGPLTRLYALKAVALVFEALPDLVNALDNSGCRAKMMEASLLAGLAISGSRTALAHSISYPITARYGMPHGLACSFTLPAILEYNAGADDGRLLEAARTLGFPAVAGFREALVELYRRLKVGDLVAQYITAESDLAPLVPLMFTPGRADNNLREASPEHLRQIIEKSLTGLGINS